MLQKDGFALRSWNLGPYYRLCPLELQRIKGEARMKVRPGGDVYSLGPNTNRSEETILAIFNEWWASLRRVEVYVIRAHGVSGVGLTEPLYRELRECELEMDQRPDCISVAVPPSVPDEEAVRYVINAFQKKRLPRRARKHRQPRRHLRQ